MVQSLTLATSFPEPCMVCKNKQFQLDMQHQIVYLVTEAFETAFDQSIDRHFTFQA